MNKTARQLLREREKRITDAIQLKIPDRVPVIAGIGYFAANYAGIPCSAAYYDYDAWVAANKKTLQDFQPDMLLAQNFTPGKALEIINPKQTKWPGHGVDAYQGHQAIEIDNMKADEYDAYLKDTSDYMFRIYMSRTSDELEGLSKIPKLSELGQGPMATNVLAEALAEPAVAHAVLTLIKAGRELRKWRTRIMKFNKMIEDMGFPQYVHGMAMAPFDNISHSLRGMSGTMQDMFRQPDKLLETCEYLLKMTLEKPMSRGKGDGSFRVFMPLTRGSDDFMSLKHFEKFYWPTLKKLTMHIIENGGTPVMFFEGNFTSRLEHLLELPKGKALAQLDTTDIYRAKEVLRDHMCIMGNVPSSLLQVGTVQDVKDHCKKLIDVIGKGGGYILSTRSTTERAKPANLKAMIEFTKEYGVYR
jgi:uroporphyrinogen-III decarboxylase